MSRPRCLWDARGDCLGFRRWRGGLALGVRLRCRSLRMCRSNSSVRRSPRLSGLSSLSCLRERRGLLLRLRSRRRSLRRSRRLRSRSSSRLVLYSRHLSGPSFLRALGSGLFARSLTDRGGDNRPSAFLRLWSLSTALSSANFRFPSLPRTPLPAPLVRREVTSSFRAAAPLNSFALSAALWLSVSRMMFLKNLVLGFGAAVVGLEIAEG